MGISFWFQFATGNGFFNQSQSHSPPGEDEPLEIRPLKVRIPVDACDQTSHHFCIFGSNAARTAHNLVTKPLQRRALFFNRQCWLHVLKACVEHDLFLCVPPAVERGGADPGSMGDLLSAYGTDPFCLQELVGRFQNVLLCPLTSWTAWGSRYSAQFFPLHWSSPA